MVVDIRGEWIVLWWPNTNTNIIRFEKSNQIRIRILLGLKKITEYEYYWAWKYWPNTNTNIIRLEKITRIRIFGLNYSNNIRIPNYSLTSGTQKHKNKSASVSLDHQRVFLLRCFNFFNSGGELRAWPGAWGWHLSGRRRPTPHLITSHPPTSIIFLFLTPSLIFLYHWIGDGLLSLLTPWNRLYRNGIENYKPEMESWSQPWFPPIRSKSRILLYKPSRPARAFAAYFFFGA